MLTGSRKQEKVKPTSNKIGTVTTYYYPEYKNLEVETDILQ